MKYKSGDLVRICHLGSKDMLGIIIWGKTVKEERTVDDLWNTIIINKDILYKVLMHGKVIKLTETFIQEKIA